MRNYLHKLVALVLFFAGVQSANAYSVTDLESGGWTKVESIENVDNYYYVFVDAKSSSYMMVDAHNRGRAYYRTLSNPLLFENSTWVLESNGNDSYALKNAVTSRYFNSGSAGWNNSLGAANDNANYKFALTNGKYDIQSVKTSQYLGPWNDNGSVAGYGEEIAANKSLDKAPGFLVYAMERTQYNEKLATVFDQVTNDNPMDLTSKIENPCADLNIDGWTKENTIGWNGNNNGYDGKKGFFEFCNWGGAWTGKLTQTISSLPNGKYIVKVAAQAAATDVVLTIEANGVSQNLNCIGDKGGNISAEGTVVELGHGVAGWQYVSLECKVSNGELTISASSSATTAQRWANVDNFTLTFLGGADESDLATEEQKQAYNKALAEAEAHVLGFAAGEYAPYTNVEALKTVEAAKAINVDEAFAEAVVEATATLEATVWTVNSEEMNAIYDGSFAADYSGLTGNVKPTGWNRTSGTNTGYEVRYMTVPEGATTTGHGMMIKFAANYGKDAGYTMPLKANSVYDLSFKYVGWGNTPTVNIVIKDEAGNAVTIEPASFKAESNQGDKDATVWQKYEGKFTTGEKDANYVLYFDKSETQQEQVGFGDFKLYSAAPAVVEVASVTLDKTEATLTEAGATVTLVATVAPEEATDKTVTWSTSDDKVATVVDGVVTAVANGKATITAKAGEKTATCEVTVAIPEVDPNDYTSYIKNAAVTSLDEWTVEGDGISHGDGLVKLKKNFDFNQTITLPAGKYKMTVKAAYRYAGGSVNVAEKAEYDAIQAGVNTHLAKVYAQTATYKYEGDVQNRWEGRSETDLYGDLEKVSVIEHEGVTYYVPNSSAAVMAWFNADKYVNELVFNVQAEGEVKIGMNKTETAPNGEYTNISAWTLTRLGDAEADPKEEEPTPEPEKPEIGDVTSKYLVNADFETPSAQNGGAINTPPGWTMTYDLGGWLDGSTRLSENPGNDASQCFNVWAGEFRNVDIYQKPVLPAGKYKLTVGFYSDGDAERYAYATVGGNTVKSERPNWGSWDFVSVEFLNASAGEVTLGAVSKGWFQIDNVTLEYLGEVLKDDFVNAYNQVLSEAKALVGQKMDLSVATQLDEVILANGSLTSESSIEDLDKATNAISAVVVQAKASAATYAANKTAIDAMFALMESTNVYTVEAYEAYKAKAEDFLVQYEAGTLNAKVDNPAAIQGWRASVDYDDLLLSAFELTNPDPWADLHVNTWSTEGESDGSDFKVPFFEYYTGDGESLPVATKTATITGLTPGQSYEVEAWVRVRAKNGVAAADATGITLTVGTGEAADLTEGDVIGTSQFSHAVYTAYGYADAEGNLTINFNVLDGNNVSWLSFKNLKYAEAAEEEPDGIHNINADADAVICDLHGRRVQKMTKGIYIVNGRKVVIK